MLRAEPALLPLAAGVGARGREEGGRKLGVCVGALETL
jgi:hypothetical protein